MAADVAPVADELVPAGHGVHSAALSVSEYVPAGHVSHEFVSAFKYCPGEHDTTGINSDVLYFTKPSSV